jgi:AAA+ ATPase superfamily predicted ATPase
LTGSLLSVMRQQVLAPDAPLYLRHTWPFELKPLTVADLPAFFPSYSPDEIVESYAVLGGMPYYLISFNPDADLMTNIRRVILSPSGSLFNEVPLQLHLEMRGGDVSLYMRVLAAIAQGAHTRGEIAQAAALQGRNISHYLLTLREMGLVVARKPLERTLGVERWARYHLCDPFLRFWLRFVAPRQAELEIGMGLDAAWNEVRLQMPRLVAPIWEQVARRHTLYAARRWGVPPVTEVGSWWDRRTQIDVVGIERRTHTVVFGEARWRQEPFTPRDLDSLMVRGGRWLRGSDARWDVHYVVYARHISPAMRTLAEGERAVHVFTPEDVVGRNTVGGV